MRVVRVYHSAVVAPWRTRDRRLIDLGVDLTLVSPKRWNEGGHDVELGTAEPFVVPARSIGRHPYAFVYDPRPIWRVLRSGRVDVLDVHEEPASLAAAELLVLRVLTSRRRHRPVVLFYGAQNIEKRFPPPFRWIERWALRTAAGVYCCNHDAAAIFRRKGFRGSARVIGLGVDIERFAPAPAPNTDRSSPGVFRLGYVGRLEMRKGVQVVVEAMTRSTANVELDVYGAGPDEDWLHRLVKLRHLTDRVRFHGYRDQSELPAVYRTVDALVVPSQTTATWVEQFGRVAVEAMASGVAVLSSDSGSLPEVVGDAGIVLPEADVAAWATAIDELSADPERRRALAAAGRARAERYRWSCIAAEHHRLYEEVLS